MKISDKITGILERQGGVITSRQITAAGVHRQTTSLYVKAGLLERVASGVFVTPDGVVDDLFVLSMKASYGVLSHGSALFLNGVTDRTPFEATMTIANNRVLTPSLRKAVKCFYCAPAMIDLGRVLRKTPMGNEVVTYDCERTVCDLIRSRDRLDDELVLDGLRQYAAKKDKNVARLGEYAKALGVLEDVRRTMEVVLW